MFYTVYKITNLVNGKIYIGVHKTDDLNDNYMGSGKLIKAAIAKYGIENFTREYLHVFDNAEDMFEMESELVNEEFVARKDTYNIMLGGNGGWDYINSSGLKRAIDLTTCVKGGKSGGKAVAHMRATNSAFNESWLERFMEGTKNRTAESFKSFSGKSHSEETKSKLREKAKLRTGEKNSSFGSMWIMNLETKESKKIKKDDSIPNGWVKGRKIKK